MNTALIALQLALAAAPLLDPASLPRPGEEVDVTAGAVTALSCATTARDQGDLGALTGCGYAEAQQDIVAYDVAEQQIYRLTGKLVFRWLLESAFGGGSVDFVGKVKKADPRSGVVVVEVSELNVTAKPKPGAFKGCL